MEIELAPAFQQRLKRIKSEQHFEKEAEQLRETKRRRTIIDIPALVSLSEGAIADAVFEGQKTSLKITTGVDPIFNKGEPLVIRDYRTRTLAYPDISPLSFSAVINSRARVIITRGEKGEEKIDLLDPHYQERGVVLREIVFIPSAERRSRIIWISGGFGPNGFYAIALENLSEAKKIREETARLIPIPA